jgi:hypothetical protein
MTNDQANKIADLAQSMALAEVDYKHSVFNNSDRSDELYRKLLVARSVLNSYLTSLITE